MQNTSLSIIGLFLSILGFSLNPVVLLACWVANTGPERDDEKRFVLINTVVIGVFLALIRVILEYCYRRSMNEPVPAVLYLAFLGYPLGCLIDGQLFFTLKIYLKTRKGTIKKQK